MRTPSATTRVPFRSGPLARRLLIAALVLGASLLVLGLSPGGALADESPEAAPPPAFVDIPVTLRGETLFHLHAGIGTRGVEDRAAFVESRLAQMLAALPEPDAVTLKEAEGRVDLYAGPTFILSITDVDAALVGRTRAQLAADSEAGLRAALERAHRARSLRGILLELALAIAETIAFLILLLLGARLLPSLRDRVRRVKLPALRIQSVEIVGSDSLLRILDQFAGLAQAVLGLALAVVFLNTVLANFEWSRQLSVRFFDYCGGVLWSAGEGVLLFLPNVGYIAVIVVGARYALKLAHLVFSELARGKLRFAGFHPAWAMPTLRIVRFLMVALATVVVVPYLPGSRSPAFQGVSLFVGLLVSFAGGSSLSNIIAGIMLMYMRPFAIGDRVRIGEATGDVLEATALVVRLRTPKNEEITIPNAQVLSGTVLNYSAEASTRGLVLHTTVTIGYDVPWKQVHQLLIGAASSVEGILAEPKPFVLQTSLDDFYVRYEINAFTDRPREMPALYSAMHQNIQDRFNEAGVEIMSPHYAAFRDGSTMAVPTSYLPKGYEPPPVRVESVPRKADRTS